MRPNLKFKSMWLWLCLVSLVVLLFGFIYVEIGVLYPQVQRYFEKTGKVTEQPLASRVRGYLFECLEQYYDSAKTESDLDEIRLKLDIAYGLLNVDLYKRQYSCTESSFKQFDLLLEQVAQKPPVGADVFTRSMLPILQCTDKIEVGQDKKRTAFATTTVAKLDYHRKLLFWGTVLLLVLAFGFWTLHLKQRRMIAAGKDEANKWIHHAMRDDLTGAFNRRAFNIDLQQNLNRYQQTHSQFSLLMCDIDHFKQYNDTFGHVEGDKALQHITSALIGVLRDQDRLYRYGGEELAIILQNTDSSQAHQVALRALEEIRNLQLPHPASQYEIVTVSIGCATLTDVSMTMEGVVALADKRLYRAKSKGRNCLICTD